MNVVKTAQYLNNNKIKAICQYNSFVSNRADRHDLKQKTKSVKQNPSVDERRGHHLLFATN